MPNANPAPNPVSFFQGCPVCGRALRVNVSLIGSRVYCQHCGGGFVAGGEDLTRRSPAALGQADVDARAEALLQRAAEVLERAGD